MTRRCLTFDHNRELAFWMWTVTIDACREYLCMNLAAGHLETTLDVQHPGIGEALALDRTPCVERPELASSFRIYGEILLIPAIRKGGSFMSSETHASLFDLRRPMNRRHVGALAFGAVVSIAAGTAAVSAKSATPEASPEASPSASPAASPVAGAANLKSLLPEAKGAPLGLDKIEDTTNDKAAALLALTSAVTEDDLTAWGWQGSETRVFTASDPSKLEEGDTATEIVTVDGFATPEGAGKAFPAYSDALVTGGYKVLDDGATYGDRAHLLWLKDEASGATDAALVIQKETVVYTIVTKAKNGSPIFDVERTAVALGLRRS